MRFLMATDLSPRSELALQRALQLAQHYGAQLSVLHVVDDELPLALRGSYESSASQLLEDTVAGLVPAGVSVQVLVKAGDAFKTIVHTADDLGADLLIVGAHRRQLLKDLFVAATVERVIRASRCPVLLVNNLSTSFYQRPMFALDLSDVSRALLATGQRLGLLDAPSYSLVHAYIAVPRNKLTIAVPEQDLSHEERAQCRKDAEQDVQRFLAQQNVPGKPHVILEEGDAAKAIEQAVQLTQPDLLIMGTQGFGGVKKMLLGSVASRLLREVECDVLAVPPAQA